MPKESEAMEKQRRWDEVCILGTVLTFIDNIIVLYGTYIILYSFLLKAECSNIFGKRAIEMIDFGTQALFNL